MKKPYLVYVIESNYCKIVFLISILLIYFLIPKNIFYGFYSLLGVLFIITAGLTITCLVRNVKERIVSAKHSGASILGIISIVIGYSAMQACSIGVSVCGTSILGGILALIFPNIIFYYSSNFCSLFNEMF